MITLMVSTIIMMLVMTMMQEVMFDDQEMGLYCKIVLQPLAVPFLVNPSNKTSAFKMKIQKSNGEVNCERYS